MKKPRESIHVLVVDDMPDSRQTAVDFLQHLGYRTLTVVNDGSEAIQALEREPGIDLILADWDMPLVTGISLLRQVRANPRWQHLPFIMMTAPKSIETEKLTQAVEGLVDDYMIKPFRLQTLEEKLNKVLALSVHGPQKTVVVVDDEKDARDTMTEFLHRFGFKKVSTFTDGDEALRYLILHPNDVGLIIADWEMPRMKGVELLSQCRANDHLRDIPFFIVTSQVSMERQKVMVAAQLQVDQYLLKPFTREQMQERIEETLRRARTAQEVRLLVEEGFQALERVRTKAAQQCFEKALALDPSYDLTLAGIGEMHWHSKGPEAAVPWFHKGLTLNPTRELHYQRLADAYTQLQQFGKAIHVLQMGQQNLPNSATMLLLLARIYLDKDMPKKAFEELTQFLRLEPDHPEAEKLLARAREELESKGQKKS